MFSSKELQDFLNFDMPHPNKSATVTPDFTNKCHYTLRIYTCTHKSFLPTPRITHVSPCLYYAVPATHFLSDLSPYYLLNESKRRCSNMASKPKEIHINEPCSKCRPHNLGVDKKLRAFEVMTPNGEQKGEVREEVFNSIYFADGEGSAHEIERGLKALSLTETETPSVPKLQLHPEPEPEPEPALTAQDVNELPENEPILEQPSDSEISTDTHGKKESWVDICPSVANGEAAPGAKSSRKGLLSRIFKPFGPFAPDTIAEETVEEVKTEAESAADGRKTGEGKGKGWVKVKDDLDWEVVNDERKEGTLWKDEGKWINVNQ
jgi:hypothetical protein